MRLTLASAASASAALLVSAGMACAQGSSLTVNVLNNKGANIGTVEMKGANNGTVLRVELGAGALPPGWHGIHLHANGDCSDHDKFMASKGHVNHAKKQHGLLNPAGPDEGDLPNLFANADGSVHAELSTRMLIAGANGIKDADGSAVIIHASPDDHTSQPIGGAGARVACAVIK